MSCVGSRRLALGRAILSSIVLLILRVSCGAVYSAAHGNTYCIILCVVVAYCSLL